MTPMLAVRDLHFNYGRTPILGGVSFEVEEGELCGLFGPNGCGKTTLFKCCLNFLKFHKGTVTMDGKDIKDLGVESMAKIVAYVPQEHKPPFPYLTREVVLMGRTPRLKGIFKISKADKEKASDALDLLGLTEIADRPYNQLSGGQRQMVLMARAIAQETPLMFLDEPTSALDFSNQIRIWRIMQMVAKRGVTILACSHDPNHVSWFCDKVVVMKDNCILKEGSPHNVITEAVLNDIYRDVCAVRNIGEARMVLPRDVALKNDAWPEKQLGTERTLVD
ncbi:MAG: Cobalamin import ATP-binding protein BtuD [Methanosaeta sp. PtaB.Bin018]|nr:MAG: Cobalamin import ATP-binding protein BtuD [Methanosaeta sp. PtaB.Bin018]OPY43191.1 MAG: Cobalamin import ATP-binding protein BtuD [Methanosaeta sp. PtaU1.Bin016]